MDIYKLLYYPLLLCILTFMINICICMCCIHIGLLILQYCNGGDLADYLQGKTINIIRYNLCLLLYKNKCGIIMFLIPLLHIEYC